MIRDCSSEPPEIFCKVGVNTRTVSPNNTSGRNACARINSTMSEERDNESDSLPVPFGMANKIASFDFIAHYSLFSLSNTY